MEESLLREEGDESELRKSDAYTGPITRSHSKGITQEQNQGFDIAQSILKQLVESPKAGNVIKENPLYESDFASSKSKKEAHPDVMSVIMADITTEATKAEMERKINLLVKVVEERDHKITAFRDQMWTCESTESSKTPLVKADDKGKAVLQENQMQHSISIASLSVQQLKGNPKQHIAHFVETCENAGSRGDQLVSWEQLEIEFLNRFYSTRRVVSMMELKNIKQRKGEPVINYINRWRALSMDYKDKLTELFVVEMCTQEQVGKVDDPNYCKHQRIISHPVEKCFVLKELILKLARENKIELDIDEVTQTNHVAIKMTSSVLSSVFFYDQRESLIQFETFKPILVRFQQKIMMTNSQYKEEPIKDDGKEWIVVARQKEKQTNFIQTKSHFHQKHSKGSISHKNKGKRNKKMSKSKPIKGKDDDFLQPRRSITLTEFFPRSFLKDNPKEILEITACHVVSVVEVDNNYVSSEEVDNSNEIKQRTFVFDRIKPSTTRSSVFQRLSMVMK
ncbi:ty3-gypsy retrotransposon protein [Cucumis melo var. makuwa]|uniref:Ty3-gypsy retrotransposon protein n=1 Tax=Cucumis melo var. makuwa TaxID=1194695 RepID=A0A5D3C3F4_CUCMM|nr:ty3-gypsy retrotransposon protein [Cucumis melo var. makuwa]